MDIIEKLKNPSFLIVDLETDSLEVSSANIKFFGGYDVNNKNFIFFQWDSSKIEECQKLLEKYSFIITFNGKNFDFPILENHSIDTTYFRHIDIYETFKKRKTVIFPHEPRSMSLNNLIKELNLGDLKKGEIDYNLFKKNEFTDKELEEIKKYLLIDLELTNKLWQFLLEKFDMFKEYVSEKDKLYFKYITCSLGSYAYKVICNQLGIEELYDDSKPGGTYIGAYVMTPTQEKVTGNILYFDFSSLYPMMYVHANLFSHSCTCCTQEEKWHGNNNLQVKGYYCKKNQGKIEQLIKKYYLLRKELKKNKDSREKIFKIVLNSLYGITANPIFLNLYHENTAADCTMLGQQCVRFAIDYFKNNGFNVLYADTDSIFIDNSNTDKTLAFKLAKEIGDKLSSYFPFPWEEFNLKLEDEIKYIQFYKDDSGNFKKKNYLYVNNNDKIVIKGLDIIQKDCSELSRIIFEEVIKKKILKELDCKLTKIDIDYCIQNILNKDIALLAKKFTIKEDEYESKTCIYNLIKQKYGSGEVFLIKNYIYGVGNSMKYCSIEEAKKLKISQLNLEDVYTELSPFIKIPNLNKTLNEFY